MKGYKKLPVMIQLEGEYTRQIGELHINPNALKSLRRKLSDDIEIFYMFEGENFVFTDGESM